MAPRCVNLFSSNQMLYSSSRGVLINAEEQQLSPPSLSLHTHVLDGHRFLFDDSLKGEGIPSTRKFPKNGNRSEERSEALTRQVAVK